MPHKKEEDKRDGKYSFPALPYELPYLTDELKRRAKSELSEDEDSRAYGLRLLKSMLTDEKDLHWQDSDLFLLAFLRARKFDVSRAFSVVKNFYNRIGHHRELYYNFDFEHVRKSLRENTVGFLPYRDREGCVVLVINTVAWNPTDNNMGDIMRTLTCGLLHAIRSPSTQVAGFKVIVDFSHFTLNKLYHISPTYLWLFAEALQNSFPGRFRAVHIINEGHLWVYVWQILKQLLNKKLRDRFHFHGKSMKKLHRHFDPSILPVEYGGRLPPFDNAEWAKMVAADRDQISEVFSYGYAKYLKPRK